MAAEAEPTRLPLVACAAVGVFLLYALVKASQIVGLLYQNGDNASALVLGELMHERGGSHIVLGNYSWIEPLFAEHLTRWVPHHKQFWELLPFAVFAVTVAVTAWTVSRVASRRAAVLVGLAMAAPSPIILGSVGVPNAHGHTLLHAVVLAAFLVSLPRIQEWSVRHRVLWAAALALTLAPGASSDQLLLAGGVAPFLAAVAAGGYWRLIDRRSAWVAGVACAAGALVGQLLALAARSDGVVSSPRTYTFVGADTILPHARLLLDTLGQFAHGRVGGPLDAMTVVHEIVGLTVLLGVPLLLLRARPVAVGLVTDRGRPAAARLLTIYWTLSAAAIVAVYVTTSAVVDIFGSRYVLTLWPAALTLVVLLAPRRWALHGLSVLAILCAAIGCWELGHGDYTTSATKFPHGAVVGDVEKFVRSEGLDHGYAGYWEAATMTAETDFRLRVYPVSGCAAGICPFKLHRIERWYAPKPGVRSFYIFDGIPIGEGSPTPPVAWGRPAKTATFGQLVVYVYDHDIAAQLGGAP